METRNRFPDLPSNIPNAMLEARKPVILWTILVCIATLFLQILDVPSLINSLFFTLLIAVHIVLHWHCHRLTKKHPWIYFVIQGAIVYASAYFMPSGAAMIALFPLLIAQSIGIYGHKVKIAVVTVSYYISFIVAYLFHSSQEELFIVLPMFILMTVVVLAVANLTFRQYYARMRMQTFLGELEIAHRKVEELTVANERQRMARDLHDTLAQGLAGIIMRLEAIDSHLTRNNVNRAHEIVQQAMVRARTTLAEARQAIDDLRSISITPVSLEEAVREEAETFTQTTGIPVRLDIQLYGELSKLLNEHGVHIIRECLTNIARHAGAEQVEVKLHRLKDELSLLIVDDGKGFDPGVVGKRLGSYGLIGIQERIRILEGTMELDSSSKGTRIEIKLPLTKGGY